MDLQVASLTEEEVERHWAANDEGFCVSGGRRAGGLELRTVEKWKHWKVVDVWRDTVKLDQVIWAASTSPLFESCIELFGLRFDSNETEAFENALAPLHGLKGAMHVIRIRDKASVIYLH